MNDEATEQTDNHETKQPLSKDEEVYLRYRRWMAGLGLDVCDLELYEAVFDSIAPWKHKN